MKRNKMSDFHCSGFDWCPLLLQWFKGTDWRISTISCLFPWTSSSLQTVMNENEYWFAFCLADFLEVWLQFSLNLDTNLGPVRFFFSLLVNTHWQMKQNRQPPDEDILAFKYKVVLCWGKAEFHKEDMQCKIFCFQSGMIRSQSACYWIH